MKTLVWCKKITFLRKWVSVSQRSLLGHRKRKRSERLEGSVACNIDEKMLLWYAAVFTKWI